MDQDLRELERRYQADPAERLPFERARVRAGFVPGDTAGIHREVEALRAPARAAGEDVARATRDAFAAAVAAGFQALPALDAIDVTSELDQNDGREWTVLFGTSIRAARPWELDADARARLERRLLACAPLLGSSWTTRLTLRLRRDGARVVVEEVDDAAALDRKGIVAYADDLELRALAIEESGLRELTLRELTDFEDDRRRVDLARPDEVLLAPADADAAFARLDDARRALDAALARYLELMDSAWFRFAHALFEEPELGAFVLHGYTPGYDDNQYCEHEQRVYRVLGDIGCDRAPPATRRLLEAVLPPGEYDHEARDRLQDALAPFEDALRRIHGDTWLLVFERTRAGVSVRREPGWTPTP